MTQRSFSFTGTKVSWLLLHLPPSSVPHLRKWHFCAFKEMLESFWHLLLPQSWILPAGYFSNLFTTPPPHCCYLFHTTTVSWLRYSCGLPAGLPPPHSWLSSISFNYTVSFSKHKLLHKHSDGFLLPLELSAQIWLCLTKACIGLTPADLSNTISAFTCLFKCAVHFLPQSLCTCCLTISAWKAWLLLHFTQSALYLSGLSLNGTYSQKPSWPSVTSCHSILHLFIVFMKM